MTGPILSRWRDTVSFHYADRKGRGYHCQTVRKPVLPKLAEITRTRRGCRLQGVLDLFLHWPHWPEPLHAALSPLRRSPRLHVGGFAASYSRFLVCPT